MSTVIFEDEAGAELWRMSTADDPGLFRLGPGDHRSNDEGRAFRLISKALDQAADGATTYRWTVAPVD